MEYGVALVRSDSGKHKVSIEIDLGALEDSFLPYSQMTRRQHGSGGTHLHKLERLQFESVLDVNQAQ